MQKLLNASAMAYCALMVFALWGWWRFFRGLRARRATEMQEAAFREAERHSQRFMGGNMSEKRSNLVEIARSFSYKLNMDLIGGAKFESRDFFASAKAECYEHDMAETSAKLYTFCKSQVLKAVNEYRESNQPRRTV